MYSSQVTYCTSALKASESEAKLNPQQQPNDGTSATEIMTCSNTDLSVLWMTVKHSSLRCTAAAPDWVTSTPPGESLVVANL